MQVDDMNVLLTDKLIYFLDFHGVKRVPFVKSNWMVNWPKSIVMTTHPSLKPTSNIRFNVVLPLPLDFELEEEPTLADPLIWKVAMAFKRRQDLNEYGRILYVQCDCCESWDAMTMHAMVSVWTELPNVSKES